MAAQRQADPVISDVLVTNRRDVAVSVTWRTDRSSTGWVEYGDREGEIGTLVDWDLGAASRVHEVTLTGLRPETTYYFRVHPGETVDDDGGALYQVTTKATGMPPVPFLAYGQVEAAGGEPAVGALVRTWLVDGEGGRSEPLSALVDGWGYWSLSLPVGDCDLMQLDPQVFDARGSEAELTGPACEVRPVPALVLSEEGVGLYLPLIMRQRR